jgi:hypothetical protein
MEWRSLKTMLRRTLLALAALPLAMVAPAFAQAQEQPPIASEPKVELKGTVTKVSTTRGEGMPYLEMRTGPETVKVTLGSMRYLMRHDFNPKAGDAIEVKGYKMKDGVVAIEVSLDGGKPLALRDSQGWPLWMRGGRGRQGSTGNDSEKK